MSIPVIGAQWHNGVPFELALLGEVAHAVCGMTAADFRRIALSLEGAGEGSHMEVTDFRVEGS